MNLHIITGASKGIGLCLARFFLEQCDHVVSLSRSPAPDDTAVSNYSFDFSTAESKKSLLERIFSDHPITSYSKITLTNNAGVIEPIKPVPSLKDEDVLRCLMINLVSPITLSAEFLRQTKNFAGELVITNVSSGAAKMAIPSWSVYCSSKAGLDSFSLNLAEEKVDDQRVKVINFEPGIVDTGMQSTIRQTSPEDFKDLDRFVEMKENSELASPQSVGEALGKLILRADLNTKNFVSVSDLM